MKPSRRVPNQGEAAARQPSCPDNEGFGGWPFSPVSPGEMHGIFLAKLTKVKEDAKGDYSPVMRTGIKKLAAADLLGPDEVVILNTMVDIVTATGECNLLAELRGLQISLLERTRPRPLALAIMSIAIDSAAIPNDPSVPRLEQRTARDIAGALVGGFYGGAIGAVIGSVALSLA